MSTCDKLEDLPVIPTINSDIVTEGCVEGNGIYDVFMKAHMDAIQREYNKQRLRGVEYSQVYLGGMQAAMQNAVTFALGKDEAATKAELARYQIIKTKADTEKVCAEIELVKAQIEKMKVDTLLVQIQGWVEVSKISSKPKDALTPISGIYYAPTDINGSVGKQIEKLSADIAGVKQKTISEKAQTDLDGVDDKSILGRESEVRRLQGEGFIRKAEVDVAKLATDARSAALTVLETPMGSAYDSASTDPVMQHAVTMARGMSADEKLLKKKVKESP